jgi:hypothetical protein
VPRAGRADWPHFLVQLDGPPIPEWIDAIEACAAIDFSDQVASAVVIASSASLRGWA